MNDLIEMIFMAMFGLVALALGLLIATLLL